LEDVCLGFVEELSELLGLPGAPQPAVAVAR
jgi:hypothetical protein